MAGWLVMNFAATHETSSRQVGLLERRSAVAHHLAPGVGMSRVGDLLDYQLHLIMAVHTNTWCGMRQVYETLPRRPVAGAGA